MNHKEKAESCEILKRFLEGRYSKEDIDYIAGYFGDHGHERTLETVCKDYWYHHVENPVATEHETGLDTILDRIHHRINLMRKKPLTAGRSGIARIIDTSVRVFYRVAAILVLGIILSGLFYYLNNRTLIPRGDIAYSEITAPMGSKIKIDLPDGSTAWLNHGTILKYPQRFGKRSRKVFISGEAYFNVEADKKNPFIIETSDIDIHALGTSFNVMAYEDDPEITVTLEEGRLDVYENFLNNKDPQKICRMKPGDHAVFKRHSKTISKRSGKTDIYTGWKDGFMIFRNDPLHAIVKRLERWYNVDIEIADEKLAGYQFTATFTNETLPQVLQLLSTAVPMDYTIKPRTIQNDNKYSKEKVVLKMKK